MQSKVFYAGLMFGAICSGVAYGDDAIPLVNDGHKNAFYSQYEVIEDHPSCSAADELAFRIPLNADDLDYVLFDPANDLATSRDGGGVQTRDACFVRTRRGAEIVETQVRCPDANTDQSGVALADVRPPVVDLEGEVTACMTPMGFSLVDFSWTATATYENEVVSVDRTGASQYQTDDISSVQEGLSSRFVYSEEFMLRFQRAERHPLIGTLWGVDMIDVEITCLPVPSEITSGRPVFIGFQAHFAIVDDVRTTCVGDDCPELYAIRAYRPDDSGQRCFGYQ